VHQRDEPEFSRPHGRQGIAGVPRLADDGGRERVDRESHRPARVFGELNATTSVATHAEVSWERMNNPMGNVVVGGCMSSAVGFSIGQSSLCGVPLGFPSWTSFCVAQKKPRGMIVAVPSSAKQILESVWSHFAFSTQVICCDQGSSCYKNPEVHTEVPENPTLYVSKTSGGGLCEQRFISCHYKLRTCGVVSFGHQFSITGASMAKLMRPRSIIALSPPTKCRPSSTPAVRANVSRACA